MRIREGGSTIKRMSPHPLGAVLSLRRHHHGRRGDRDRAFGRRFVVAVAPSLRLAILRLLFLRPFLLSSIFLGLFFSLFLATLASRPRRLLSLAFASRDGFVDDEGLARVLLLLLVVVVVGTASVGGRVGRRRGWRPRPFPPHFRACGFVKLVLLRATFQPFSLSFCLL